VLDQMQDAQRVPPPPDLPPPTLSPAVIRIPPTEVVVDGQPEDTLIIPKEIAPPDDHLPPRSTPPHVANRVSGGPGKGFPNTEDFYPFDAIRSGTTGITGVQVCVDEKGRLTAAPTLAQTSGSASLDAGALKLAKAGSGHYRATTEDGRPVSSCYAFRIRFDINKR